MTMACRQAKSTIIMITGLAMGCAALLLGGCSTAVNYGAANISSTPSGAEIVNLRDDTNLGKTPAQVVWKGGAGSSRQVTVQLRKRGFHPVITSFWVNQRHGTEEAARVGAVDVHAQLIEE